MVPETGRNAVPIVSFLFSKFHVRRRSKTGSDDQIALDGTSELPDGMRKVKHVHVIVTGSVWTVHAY